MTNVLNYTFTTTPAPRPVAHDALLERICVRPPYFALHCPQLEGEVFVAEAKAELPQGLALGPMRGSAVRVSHATSIGTS